MVGSKGKTACLAKRVDTVKPRLSSKTLEGKVWVGHKTNSQERSGEYDLVKMRRTLAWVF